jgi:hypothetical protein
VSATTTYFRFLAARCRTSARDCRDHFAKEEFRRLAQEFEIRADHLECASQPTEEPDWWLSQREQSRGFAGDR